MGQSTIALKLIQMEDENTIYEQKTANNVNWDTLDSKISEMDKYMHEEHLVYFGHNPPPENSEYRIWIDPYTDYRTPEGLVVATGHMPPPMSSDVVLWLDDDN